MLSLNKAQADWYRSFGWRGDLSRRLWVSTSPIRTILRRKGLTNKAFRRYLGISRRSYDAMLYEPGLPRSARLKKMARFLRIKPLRLLYALMIWRGFEPERDRSRSSAYIVASKEPASAAPGGTVLDSEAVGEDGGC